MLTFYFSAQKFIPRSIFLPNPRVIRIMPHLCCIIFFIGSEAIVGLKKKIMDVGVLYCRYLLILRFFRGIYKSREEREGEKEKRKKLFSLNHALAIFNNTTSRCSSLSRHRASIFFSPCCSRARRSRISHLPPPLPLFLHPGPCYIINYFIN